MALGLGQGDVAGSVKPVPLQVGPVHFETLGKLISVRCPREYAGMMRQHGGEWDPGARRWLIERRRIRCSGHSGATPIRCSGG
jgi:hypothetical protein